LVLGGREGLGLGFESAEVGAGLGLALGGREGLGLGLPIALAVGAFGGKATECR
jgi:hypothetical protein